MSLEFIRTKLHAFIVNTQTDSFRDKLNIVFGTSIHLFAKHVVTEANPAGTMAYSDYISPVPVQVCNKNDVIEKRNLNDQELDIYNRLSQGRKLVKSNREYLVNNFLSESVSGEQQTSLDI